MSDKIYEQSVGFLRIIDGDNPLDKTDIHPEHYKEALLLLKNINCDIKMIGTEELKNKLVKLDND